MLKKIISVVFVVLLLVTFSVPFFAIDDPEICIVDYDEYGHWCTNEMHLDCNFDCATKQPHTVTDLNTIYPKCNFCAYQMYKNPPTETVGTLNENTATETVISLAVANKSSAVYLEPSVTTKIDTIITTGTIVPVLDTALVNGFVKVSVDGSATYMLSSSLNIPSDRYESMFPVNSKYAKKNYTLQTSSYVPMYKDFNNFETCIVYLEPYSSVSYISRNGNWAFVEACLFDTYVYTGYVDIHVLG